MLIWRRCCSKSSPPPAAYDKAGKPFARILAATGCTAGPGAIDCLRNVPFEVSTSPETKRCFY